MDPRTRALLESPIASTLLRLAAPNVLVLFAQAAAGLIETYFVGKLGTDALAGVALVFPVFMLMQMMSAGAMGGGIASSIARALGGARAADANALALHALAITLGFGFAFTIGVLGGGRWLYSSMGGSGGALDAALIYSHWIFAGAVLVWLFNSLSAVIRGTGNMAFPAVVTCVGVAVLHLWSGKGVVRPSLGGARFRWPLFLDILRVGLVAALVTVATNLTVMIGTGLVGQFGPAAIAGYGTGARLEYLLVPLVFGLGAPLVAMVGTAIGAGQRERALRTAWTGAAIAMALTEAIGLLAAFFPHAWLGLFDTNPAMLDAGTRYLRIVGLFYGMFGLALSLYFASQGAGRLLWPLIANLTRVAIAAFVGRLALRWSGELSHVFLAQSVALVAYGSITAAAVFGAAWFGPIAWPGSGKSALRGSSTSPGPST
jgi:MATE family, multidrug efflux pump